MAYTPLKISIPEPCHEDWNGMHPVPGTTARHCNSCAKSVVDFTGFSDVQMHAYVREQGGKLCGRFRPDQLDRPLRAVSTPTRNPLKVAAAAAGLLLATTSCDTPKSASEIAAEGEAMEIQLDGVVEIPMTGDIYIAEGEQLPTPLPEIEMATVGSFSVPPTPPPLLSEIDGVFPPPSMPPVAGKMIATPMPPPAFEDETVEGEIMIEDFEESSLVTCGTKSVEQVIATEEFLVGDIEFVEEDLLPPAALTEHDTTPPSGEIIAPESFSNLPVIEISSHQGVFMGIVAVKEPRPTGMDWIKDTLRNVLPSLPALPAEDPSLHQRPRPEMPQHLEALTVYPNPFVDHLKVEINLPAGEMLTVELLDPTGQLVFAQAWKASAGANTLTIEPKQRKLKHAIYYLRVTDEREFSVVKPVVK